MDLRVGDRVNFLNEKGGGIVTKILNNKMVNVAIEEGFDIPTMISNLVKVQAANDSNFNTIVSNNVPSAEKFEKHQKLVKEVERTSAIYLDYDLNTKPAEGIYLCFVPDNQEKLVCDKHKVYLINNSEFNVLFSIFLNYSGDYQGLDYGTAEPKSKIKIADIHLNEIDKWTNGLIQLIFHKNGKTKTFSPHNEIIKLKPVNFYKETHFTDNKFLGFKAYTYCICEINNLKDIQWTALIDKNEDKSLIKEKLEIKEPQKIIKDNSLLNRYKIEDKVAEIDLHIGELIDNHSGLSNADMIKIQLDFCVKCLNAGFTEHFNKLIFIHGVGNGVLKSEIIKILDTYPNIKYYDASLSRYGVGATEVSINHNILKK